MTNKRLIVVACSDEHAGHKLGLTNPETKIQQLESGDWGCVYLNKIQSVLWQTYTDIINRVNEVAGKSPVVLVKNGDVCHGNKHPDQLISNRPVDQIHIAIANVDAMAKSVKNLKGIVFSSGTDAHEFNESSAVSMLVTALKERRTKYSIDLARHSIVNIGGVPFDIAHTGPSNARAQWNDGNAARIYLRDRITKCIRNEDEVPRVFIRSHIHQFVHEGMRFERVKRYGSDSFVDYGRSDIVVTPAMCGVGQYAHQVTQAEPYWYFGAVLFVVEDGDVVEIQPLVRKVDVRTRIPDIF